MLRDLNQAFKEARKVEPSLRSIDYLEARKAGGSGAGNGSVTALVIQLIWLPLIAMLVK